MINECIYCKSGYCSHFQKTCDVNSLWECDICDYYGFQFFKKTTVQILVGEHKNLKGRILNRECYYIDTHGDVKTFFYSVYIPKIMRCVKYEEDEISYPMNRNGANT